MNINLSLIGQMVTFIGFVWFTMKFVWPPLSAAIEQRRQTIAEGIAAGEQGKRDLASAGEERDAMLTKARSAAQSAMQRGEARAGEIIAEAKTEANKERERILAGARAQTEQEMLAAREALRAEVVALALAGAGKILEAPADSSAHSAALERLAKQL